MANARLEWTPPGGSGQSYTLPVNFTWDYQELAQDQSTPPLWQSEAQEEIKIRQWDRQHPEWAILADPPAGKRGQK